eukprot:Hpha_TRINITY_DN5716_c0_g1::TRINITY_DN5716_c0_g1_i1::g.147626::m.147626
MSGKRGAKRLYWGAKTCAPPTEPRQPQENEYHDRDVGTVALGPATAGIPRLTRRSGTKGGRVGGPRSGNRLLTSFRDHWIDQGVAASRVVVACLGEAACPVGEAHQEGARFQPQGGELWASVQQAALLPSGAAVPAAPPSPPAALHPPQAYETTYAEHPEAAPFHPLPPL